MKRVFLFSSIAVLGLTLSAWGAGLSCSNCGEHCIEPPPADCPDCGCPCAHRHCWLSNCAHAQKLVGELASGECAHERVRAARKLGCRLHADFCCTPEVLDALIRALQNDSCWEVRRAAAWSIAMQGARTDAAVLALYLAARLDHHYMVRDGALEALDVLLVCRRDCFKDLFARADVLAVELRKGGFYKPGCNELNIAFSGACTHADVQPMPATATELIAPPSATPMPRGK
jgi:hypothetical protein